MRTIKKILVILVLTYPLCSSANESPPPMPTEEQPEVLTRGPVHEAFAEPVNLQPQPGLVTPIQPPANIVENPPASRPAGSQFVWVPGYWAWDSDQNGYIWISGCWRAAPPNMYWVSGYWSKAPQGWQWVPGFWMPVASTGQIQYLPAPPAIDETQPAVVEPYLDSIWVPSCWYWYQGQYVHRPGYWLKARADWIWMPSHYVWTPRGYMYLFRDIGTTS